MAGLTIRKFSVRQGNAQAHLLTMHDIFCGETSHHLTPTYVEAIARLTLHNSVFVHVPGGDPIEVRRTA